jgi:hypothetical protein
MKITEFPINAGENKPAVYSRKVLETKIALGAFKENRKFLSKP